MIHHVMTRNYCQLYRSYGRLDKESLVLQDNERFVLQETLWTLVYYVNGLPPYDVACHREDVFVILLVFELSDTTRPQ